MSDPTDPNELPPPPPAYLDAYGAPPAVVGGTVAPGVSALPNVADASAPPAAEPPLPGMPVAMPPMSPAAPGAPSWLQSFGPALQPPPDAAPPAPPPQQPDAISGVGGAPMPGARDLQKDATDVAFDPSTSDAGRQAAFAQLTPQALSDALRSGDPRRMAAAAAPWMPQEVLATIAVNHEAARQHELAAQQLELQRQAEANAARDYQTQQMAFQHANDATAALSVQAQQLAQQKIDPAEHGVGNFITSVVTGALGGAMSQYTGGRNLALEELDKKTQQRIDAQKADIANGWKGIDFKRNLIAEQLASGVDESHAAAAYHLAAYDRATSELQTRMQDYDPQGTTALRSAGVVQQIQAQRAQVLQAAWQQNFNNTMTKAKVQQEIDKQRADEAAKKIDRQQKDKEIANQAWSIASENQRSAAALADHEKDRTQAREDKLDAKNLTAADKVKAQGIFDPQGNVYINKDGSPWIASEKDSSATRGQLASAQQLVDNLAELKKMIDDGSYIDPKGNARAATLYASIKASAGEALHARFNEKEQEQLDDVFGGDPTKLKNADDRALNRYGARFDQIIDTTTKNANDLARRQGYTGARGVIINPTPPTSAAQQSYEKILADKTQAENAADAEPGIAHNALGRVMYPITGAPDEQAQIEASQAPLSDAQENEVRSMARAYAKAPTAEQADIAQNLRKLLTSDRPQLAQGVYAVMKNEDPSVAAAVLGTLPKAIRGELEKEVPTVAIPQMGAR